MAVISSNFRPLDGNEICDRILQRTVKIQGQRGSSLVNIINLIRSLGVTENDVDAVSSNLPGSMAYDVVFTEPDKLTSFLASMKSDETVFQKLRYKFESYGSQVVHIRVHWLPIFIGNKILEDFFSQFGKVLKIELEKLTVQDFVTFSGVRIVTVEMSQQSKNKIPHVVNFECGNKALLTMRGRPPLCLRCMQLGHVGRDCPGKVIRPTVSLSVGKQASEVAKPVEDTGSVSTWTDVVRKGKKAKKAPETQDAAPATSPPGDQTPSPVTSEMPVVETKEMEVSEGTSKRKLETEEEFTPMPRNRVVSGVEQVESGGIDMSDMLSQDSIYDGMLATQSPHRM